MKYIDVFNGDADGICALHQLRLSDPVESDLITGLKRDISLLTGVEAGDGDIVTVLDISLDKNREDLVRLLDQGCVIEYFDHHFAGEIPEHPNLKTTIDASADVCTSLLVNQRLDGKFLPWAVTAAFGDNLHDSAHQAAAPLALSAAELNMLCDLGTYLNYNGYGVEPSDLLFHPAELYQRVRPYADPFDFVNSEPAYQELKSGFEQDMQTAMGQESEMVKEQIAVYILPDAPWSRRVSGVFGNQLARNHTERAHALLTKLDAGGYRVSVRAPLSNREGADVLCRKFPSGGGRKAAAGINHLPEEQLSEFIDSFRSAYQST